MDWFSRSFKHALFVILCYSEIRSLQNHSNATPLDPFETRTQTVWLINVRRTSHRLPMRRLRHLQFHHTVMADILPIRLSSAHWVDVEQDQLRGHKLQMTRVTKTVVSTSSLARQDCTTYSIEIHVRFLGPGNARRNQLQCRRSTSQDALPSLAYQRLVARWVSGYLWNIWQKKTPDTTEIVKRERYACISHTCGR